MLNEHYTGNIIIVVARSICRSHDPKSGCAN